MRHSDSGYTLLETLLALACVALIGIPILTIFGSVGRISSTSQVQLEQIEFARSLVEEVRVTRDRTPRHETYKGRYQIELSFQEQAIPENNRYAPVLALYQMTVTVDDLTSATQPFRGEYFVVGPQEQ
ncbi:hypothetical protein [Octadecabacter ascidiaceicola]|uniref:Uncharacterized protein n=1 Tax=Octadecabacter ascidiaceicola TaxID=1655543 RepID=A0A238K5H8_9RHOB|nr:hypothetical protein [Octadecabacter ascidiaceicola]SMX38160.1 hypothetical protein OCA8868_01711 [Octadecabacter ascidiaceicola]